MAAATPILQLRNIVKSFGTLNAVDGVSLDIVEGELFTIVGPSGSGKTTLIRLLVGMDKPTSGDIMLRGKRINDVPANKRPTCMVFQSLALFPHMSVGENVEYSAKCKGIGKKERRQRAAECLKLSHLPQSYYDKAVTQCSGGERQRVALARALAFNPEILFFDEPLSAIDYRLRKTLEKELKDIQRETGKTFVYITHSLEEAMVMSDRIAIMKEGRVVQAGTPGEIYYRPANRFVAGFMGEVNVLEIAGGRIAELGIEAPDQASGFLVVRPEFLRRLEEGDRADVRFKATITNDYMLGSRTQYHLEVGQAVFVAEVAAGNSAGLSPGQRADWGFDFADAALLSE